MKNVTPEPTDEEKELIETLVKYPSLETAYDASSASFAEIRQKMHSSITSLERVVRRGDRANAERAALVIGAYQTTLSFLNELEQIGKNQPK